jgi:hypothetical protein
VTAAILDFVRFITEAGKSFMPQPIDEDPGKPVHIWTRTGCKPLLAGGNADGDAAMLRTARFGLLIRHDDRCGAPPGGTISGRWGREYLRGGSPG